MAELSKKSQRAWRRLEKAHAKISAAIEQALKTEALPPLLWLHALNEFDRADEASLRPYQLQNALGLEQPAVSRLLDQMTKAGLIARHACADDRRGWTAATTERGRRIREDMTAVHAAQLSTQFLAHISDKQARMLDEILGEILDSLGRAKER